MERKIPENLDYMLLYPLFEKSTPTKELYINKIIKFEKSVEKDLCHIFKQLNISAMVKSDRYSLPYQKEVVNTLYGESFLSGAYEYNRTFRSFVKEILEQDDIYKIRFYIQIDIITPHTTGLTLKETGWMGKIVYRFRYFNHK